jgi:hypothetical protein
LLCMKLCFNVSNKRFSILFYSILFYIDVINMPASRYTLHLCVRNVYNQQYDR